MTATVITTAQVKELRTRTGCAILDCKEALTEAGGDVDEAITILRTKGKAKAAKKAERVTHEGVITSYVHSNGKIGVLVSLLCETDFVARNERFRTLARDLALHIAAMDPLAVSTQEIDPALLETERKIATQQAAKSGKPADIQAKIVEGKLKKYQAEHALLTQLFVKDPSKSIADVIGEAVAELGENITVGGFFRLVI